MESFTFHDLGHIDYADALKIQTDRQRRREAAKKISCSSANINPC